MHLSPGDRFRHYRIVARVGQGGMGAVYRASDTILGRDVALKFILHGPQLDSESGRRLRLEARALAALNHPNILTIYEIGDEDGIAFLSLEWAGGGSLADRDTARPLPVAEFLRLALPVAEALGAAHGRGIVHRDVKPGNVLLTDDGRVKLADFGLARWDEREQDVTRSGSAAGTLPYMAPEALSGGLAAPAVDVFSFGVLAYELLAGVRPFRAPTAGGLVGAIVAGDHVPLGEVRRDVPHGVAELIDRCLRTDASERPRDGTEAAAALRLAVPGGARAASIGMTPAEGPALRTGRRALDQQIRFTKTADGVSIAYSVVGEGPLVVRVLGHFTHLEAEWEWPELRCFWESLAERHALLRYDGRGMGLSERYAGEFTEETRQRDLEAVLDAAGAAQAILLGISEGGWTAATYAVAHPERVSHLVLYGAYCQGAQVRPGYDPEEDRALLTLIRKGWGRDTPEIRQVITSKFFRSDAHPALLAHFNELQRVSADPDTAARYLQACHLRGDGRDLYGRLSVPTLVLHCREDLAVSADEGRLLASTIPGAQLVLLPSGTHYFPTDPAIARKAAAAIHRFLGGEGEHADSAHR